MRTLDQNQIENIFQELRDNISPEHGKAIIGVDNVKPSHHEFESLEWRYRLGGYTEALCACDILSNSVYESAIAEIFGQRPRDGADRPGRKHKYSVDIKTEQNKQFTFDVPSMNPLDAYFQLTKRIAYKTIPGIVSVLVYAGFHTDRKPDSSPLRSFEKDELVFVSLV